MVLKGFLRGSPSNIDSRNGPDTQLRFKKVTSTIRLLRVGDSPRTFSTVSVISGSADHVDGLPPTRPVYLSNRTRAGTAGWGQPWPLSKDLVVAQGMYVEEFSKLAHRRRILLPIVLTSHSANVNLLTWSAPDSGPAPAGARHDPDGPSAD
jgi:hypothetical protein